MKSLRTNTLFEQIIREEYIQTKINQIRNTHFNSISEQKLVYTKSLVDPEYAKNPKNPWTGNKAKDEAVLKSLGAQPYSLGINPDGLELLIYNKNGVAQDRIRFKQDGSVYITDTMQGSLKWEIDGNVVNIKDGSNVIGTIKKISGKPQYIESTFSKNKRIEKEKEEKEDIKQQKEYESGENKFIDTLQTVLDYAGIIPVIGDALDIINAAIYFIRGKWFDGLLSSIAIIPIVGSAISLGAKSLKSALKIGKNVPGPNDLKKMWELFVDNKILKKEELATVSKGMSVLSGKLKSTYGSIQSIPVLSAAAKKSIIGSLKQFDKLLYDAGDAATSAMRRGEFAKKVQKTLDFKNVIAIASKRPELINKLSKKLEFKPWTKGSATDFIAKTINPPQWGKMIAKVPGIGARILANAPWFSASKLASLNSRMVKQFIRQMSDPHLLASVIETMPNRNAFRKQVNDYIIKNGGGSATNIFAGTKTGAENSIDWLKNLKRSNSKYYDKLANDVISNAVSKGSSMWAMFQRDALNQLKTVFDKDLANPFKSKQWGAWLTELGVNASQWRKWYDVVFSEIEDTMEQFGIVNQDEANGFIADTIINTIKEKFPEAAKTISDTKKSIEKAPEIQYVKKRAKEKLSTNTYDPSTGDVGGVYNK